MLGNTKLEVRSSEITSSVRATLTLVYTALLTRSFFLMYGIINMMNLHILIRLRGGIHDIYRRNQPADAG